MNPDEPTDQRQLVACLHALVEIDRGRTGSSGWAFRNTADLVLTLGQWGIPRPLPPGRARGPAGACYANAREYGRAHGRTYVEGFALAASGCVYAHAWCIDSHRLVEDPTWQHTLALAYLGIPLTAGYVDACAARFGDAPLIHDPHLDQFRILRTGLPTHALAHTPSRSPGGSPRA